MRPLGAGPKIALLVGALMTFPAILPGQQTVVLANGDRLTGTVSSVAGGEWVISYRGAEVHVPAGDIASFTGDDVIGVRLTDGTVGQARAAGEQLQVTTAEGTTRTVRPSEIAAVGSAANLAKLREIKTGFLTPFDRFWSATGGAGYSDKSGNSRARGVSLALELARRSPRDRLTLGFGMNREESQPPGGVFAQTVNRYYGTARLDVFVLAGLFVFGETRQERDRFQDIRLRSTYNAGLGYQAIALPETDLRFSTSGGLRRELFFVGGSDQAAVIGFGSEFKQLFGPTTFGWRLDWNPTVENFEDYRLRSDASITATAYKGLGIRLGLLNEYNSRPQPSIRSHDMLVTTTLTYSIGR